MTEPRRPDGVIDLNSDSYKVESVEKPIPNSPPGAERVTARPSSPFDHLSSLRAKPSGPLALPVEILKVILSIGVVLFVFFAVTLLSLVFFILGLVAPAFSKKMRTRFAVHTKVVR